MGSGRIAGVLAGVLLAATLVVFSSGWPSARGDPGDAPSWSRGKSWTYQGYYVDRLTGRENFTVTTWVASMNATMAILMSSYLFSFGSMASETQVTQPLFGVESERIAYSGGRTSNLTFWPPLRLYSFPLTAGKTWRCVTIVDDGINPVTFTYNYTVRAVERVTTAAGAFDAFPVEQNAMGIPSIDVLNIVPDLGTAVLYYSGDAGNLVKYEAFDTGGAKTADVSLIAPMAAGEPLPVAILAVSIIAVVAVVLVAIVVAQRARRKATPPPEAPPSPPR